MRIEKSGHYLRIGMNEGKRSRNSSLKILGGLYTWLKVERIKKKKTLKAKRDSDSCAFMFAQHLND